LRVLVLFISGLFLAGHVEANDGCFFRGFYVGESIGVAINSTDFTSDSISTYTALPRDLLLTPTFEGSAKQEKLWGEIFVGWGCFFCERLYLGPRLGVNFSSYNLTAKSTSLLSTPSGCSSCKSKNNQGNREDISL